MVLWAPFLMAVGAPAPPVQCGNFLLQVHNDQILRRPLHLDLLSDLQAGGAGEAPASLLSLLPPQMLRIKRGI